MLQKHTRISLQGSWVYRKLNVLELQNVCSLIKNKKKRRFHCKVRGFIEKEIVQLECGRGSPACMQEISKLLVSVRVVQGLRVHLNPLKKKATSS